MAEKINITFLGTGSAVPTKTKNHAAILMHYKNHHFLFDCGEGTQRQFRYARLNPCKINKLFITHWHGDHTLGIPGLLQTLAMNNYNGVLEIHGPMGTKEKMKFLMDFHMKSYLKSSQQMGNTFEIKVYEHKPNVTLFETEEMLVRCFALDHGINAIGYSFEIKEKIRINKEKLQKLNLSNHKKLKELSLGKNIEIDGKKLQAKDLTYTEKQKKVCYASDTKYTKELVTSTKNADLLIIEATYSEQEKEEATLKNHLTAKQAATIAKQADVNHVALVHLSQRYERNTKVIKSQAKEIFDGKITVPHDLDTMSI